MPNVYIDRTDDVGCDEQHGVIRALTRKARVIFESVDSPPGSFYILEKALALCPQPFTTPPIESAAATVINPSASQQSFITSTTHRFGSLVLVERKPKVVADDPWVVDVTLEYRHVLDGPNQSVISPSGGILVGKGKTSIVDKSTNFFYPEGNSNLDRVQISVGHTFPEHDVGIAGLPIDPNLPRTVIQGGEVNIPFPQSNFSMQGYWEPLRDPVETSFNIVAHINDRTWMGRPAYTWICSEMQWECIELSKHRYRVSFEFQYNVDTWDPTVVFLDQRTGRPPASVRKADEYDPDYPLFGSLVGISILSKNRNVYSNAIQPAGMWRVPALGRRDFDAFFGAFFNGSNPSGVS